MMWYAGAGGERCVAPSRRRDKPARSYETGVGGSVRDELDR